MKLKEETLTLLKEKKILLAFSGGVDSSALFFLLHDSKVRCDLAIVDYGIREESFDEVVYARELANAHKVECFSTKAPLFDSDFEAKAREFRYSFFEQLISKHNYDILLTAHQLNDQLEWFLMRLTKGAGASELVGLREVTQKVNYLLVRPLLEYSKEELLEYLRAGNKSYFIDSTNSDENYERNYFRVHFSDKLVAKYKEGIKKSLQYIKSDALMLEENYEIIFKEQELVIALLKNKNYKSKAVDILLKRVGYLLSSKQRKHIDNSSGDIVIGGVWAIGMSGDLLFVSPYIKTVMSKRFKDWCRIAKIPPLIRGYIYQKQIKELVDEKQNIISVRV